MRAVLIVVALLVTSCNLPSTCPNESCVEQPGVAPTFMPVLVPDTNLMLEGEFQDDTIGQPRF